MRKHWLIGAAAALVAGLPGVAMADTNGNVKFTYASLDEEGDGDKEDAIALSGAFATDIGSSGWRLQFNGVGASMDHGGHNDDFSQYEAHAIYNFGDFSLGGFTGHFVGEDAGSYWEFGAEGAVTLGRFGISANAAALTATNDGGDDGSNYGLNGYFQLTDNISISGSGSWSDFDFDDVESYGLGAHFALANGIGIGVGWRTSEFGASGETDALGVSLGWNFGEGGSRMMPGAMGLVPDAIARQ
jgi:hypothetical protein